MEALTSGDTPLLRRVRGRKTGRVLYGFGDASKSAFGATIQIEDRLLYQYGQWSSEIMEKHSSNWKELCNLVEALYHYVRMESLQGYEIFMFTDNSTAEAAFWKGTSESRELFDLVLRLKQLELREDLILHVIHISGRRMIWQGTDGLSRADHSQGVMRGKPIEDFVPLHLNALERAPLLQGWLEDITRTLDPTFLEPEGWYSTGHERGTYIWVPAPGAAEVVVEQLGRARLKRPESMHIILVPRIMTGRWRRLLTRGSEFNIKLDWSGVWDCSVQFEPLLMFVCLPYSSASPKFSEQKKLLDGIQRSMLQAELQSSSSLRRRYLLRQFLQRARKIRAL